MPLYCCFSVPTSHQHCAQAAVSYKWMTLPCSLNDYSTVANIFPSMPSAFTVLSYDKNSKLLFKKIIFSVISYRILRIHCTSLHKLYFRDQANFSSGAHLYMFSFSPSHSCCPSHQTHSPTKKATQQ